MTKLTSSGSRIILAQVALYLLLFFSSDNKTFFGAIIIFAGYLFWLLRDWRQAAWLTFVAVFPFGWGLRTMSLKIPLPFNFITYTGEEHFFVSFSLTARFLIGVFLFLTLALRREHWRTKLEAKDSLLFLFLACSLVSVARSQDLAIALLGFLHLMFAGAIFLTAKYVFRQRKTCIMAIQLLLVIAMFEGLWAGGQYVLQRPLGRILEESLQIFPYGKSAAENAFQFRSSGTFTDPITLGVFLSLLFPIILTQFFYKKALGISRLFVALGLMGASLGIILSFSRGVWLLTGVLSLFLLRSLAQRRFLVKISMNKYLWLSTIVGGVLLLPKVLVRLFSFQETFSSSSSSWTSRLDLIQEAWAIIQQRPFWGVGPNHFLSAMAQNQVTDIARFFFFPVHNLFLLLASEVGIIATATFVTFLLLRVRQHSRFLWSTRKVRQATTGFGLQLGLAGLVWLYTLEGLIYYRTTDINFGLFFFLLGMLEGYHESLKAIRRRIVA